MKEFTDYILRFGHLNQQQIDLIVSKASENELKKGDYFVEAGHLFNKIAFMLEGILRICYYNNQGDEITKYFVDEHRMIANPYKGEPLTEYIEAATDCKMIIFSEHDWEDLRNTIVGWESITHKIFQKGLMEKLDRRSSLVSEDATTRYLTFLEKFPGLANRVSLAHIASYLGITQQSLSRIRKNLK